MLFSLLSVAALTPLSLAAVHKVTVGGLKPDGTPNLAFTPNNIQTAVGDIIQFTFNVKNHTATQSSFDEPCAKLKNAYGQEVGFDSLFEFVDKPYGYLPTFEVTVNDSNPIWVYCRQVNPPNPTHCQSGMVFAANAEAYGKTFDKFLENAKASKAQDTGSSSYSYSSTSATWGSGSTETVTVTKTVTETTTVKDSWESSTYWPGAPASTWAANPATHTVIVGGKDGFIYNPPNITANVGDQVQFLFMRKNHTATQSSFDEPCRKIADTTYPPVYGFDSGFKEVDANATYFPNFTVTVNNTNPVWVYCQQQAANFSHCGVGMVFSINANPFSDKSFEAFQKLAVTKNGTGFVNQFGNLTAPPAPSYTGYPGSYGSGSGAGSKSVQNFNALSDADSDSSADKISKLVTTYAPAALGLLGAAIALLIALIVIGVVLLRRSKRNDGSRHFMPSATYQTVPLTVPHFTGMKDGAHEYEEPRYSDKDV